MKKIAVIVGIIILAGLGWFFWNDYITSDTVPTTDSGQEISTSTDDMSESPDKPSQDEDTKPPKQDQPTETSRVKDGCVITGCSSQVCADEDVVTDCLYKEEYICYQKATCERQDDGQCGWTMTDEIQACVEQFQGDGDQDIESSEEETAVLELKNNEKTPEAQVSFDPGEVLGDYASELLHSINKYRQLQAIGTLQMDQALVVLAKDHAMYMNTQGTLSHDGFQERFDASGKRRCVENVGWNYATAKAQFEGWKQSPGHNENMLNPHITHVGIAKDGAYVTMFACA